MASAISPSSRTTDGQEWNEKRALQLIKEYRAIPILWDKNCPFYYNNQMRADAWNDIGKAMEMSPAVCKNKMYDLMASYRREKAKIMSEKDKDKKKRYKSNWFAFEDMEFVKEHSTETTNNSYRNHHDIFMSSLLQVHPPKRRKKRSNSTNEGRERDAIIKYHNRNKSKTAGQNSNSDLEFVDETQLPKARPVISITQTYPPQAPELNQIPLTESPTVVQMADLPLLRPMQVREEKQPSESDEEEINSFAKFIAMKMKKFSQSTKNAVQKDICEIIFKADLGFYEQIKDEGRKDTAHTNVQRFHVDQPSSRNDTVIKTYFSDDE